MVERYLLLISQDPIEQLKQVIQTFHLKLDRDSFFTRCLDCNTPIESVPKAEVQSGCPRTMSIARRISFINVRPVTSSFGAGSLPIRLIFRIG